MAYVGNLDGNLGIIMAKKKIVDSMSVIINGDRVYTELLADISTFLEFISSNFSSTYHED